MNDWLSATLEKSYSPDMDELDFVEWAIEYRQRSVRVLRELAGVVVHVMDFEPGDAMIAMGNLSDDAKELCVASRE